MELIARALKVTKLKITGHWKPMDSIVAANVLMDALPEDCRQLFVRNLCFETDAFMDNRGAGALAARDWKLLSATPRQITKAIADCWVSE